ncbi:membrane-like protein [marine bacterium AO1-C]|nr:membrane-like protein [marine bacterium AO1-C]
MEDLKREDIRLISQNSNWTAKRVDQLLREKHYNNAESWQRFLRIIFISLGIGFTVTGILFFFAYNWAGLHKFVKIGLIEVLIVATTIAAVLPKLSPDIKNIVLTGASVLVGVLFAVFGQVYQTGANAYDFFLAWTAAITLWVLVAGFAPLWVVYLTLINTTIILYSEQVAHGWSAIAIFTVLFLINGIFLILTLAGSKVIKAMNPPVWFSNLIALAAFTFATIGIIIGIFDKQRPSFYVLIIITSLVYGVGLTYGIRNSNRFYLTVIPFSLITIASAFLLKLSNEAWMFLIISIFVVTSVTLVIKKLIDLQKKQTNEEQ